MFGRSGSKVRKLKDKGSKLLREQKHSAALKVYQQVLELAPDEVACRMKLGDIHRRLDEREPAIEAYSLVAKAYEEDGLLLKAIAVTKQILELDPKHPDARAMLNSLHRQRGQGTEDILEGLSSPESVPQAQAVPVVDESSPGWAARSVPLFSELPKDAFVELLVDMDYQRFSPGEVIIEQGSPGNSFFVLVSGKVEVTRRSELEEEVTLAALEDGAFFGEMALLQDGARTASVRAQKECEVFELNKDTLGRLVERHPSVGKVLHDFYRKRLLGTVMSTSPLFRSFDGIQRGALMKQFSGASVAAGAPIIVEGDKAEALYVVLSGALRVHSSEGKEFGSLSVGDIFGEMSLLTGEPAGASVSASSACHLLKLPKKHFDELIMTHPTVLELVSRLSTARSSSNHGVDVPLAEIADASSSQEVCLV